MPLIHPVAIAAAGNVGPAEHDCDQDHGDAEDHAAEFGDAGADHRDDDEHQK